MMRPGNVGSSACADDEYLKTDAQSKPRLFEQKNITEIYVCIESHLFDKLKLMALTKSW